MKPVYFALSIIDIIAGIAVFFSFYNTYFGIFILLKAIYSIVLAFTNMYFFDWMGYTDFITGLILIFGFGFSWFGIIMILKGVYSAFMSLG